MSAQPSQPLHPLVAVGVLVLIAGLAAWIWTGEWRWAATGVLLLLLSAVAVALVQRRR